MLSYTADNGATYSTRKIRVEDLLNDIAQDSDLQALVTLSGVAAGDTDLGSFTGETIADASTMKEALQALETALEEQQLDAAVGFTDAGVVLVFDGASPHGELASRRVRERLEQHGDALRRV